MILGIDIGGTKCAAALGTAAGEIAARLEMETRAAEGPQAILERLIATARELLAREGLRAAELEGIGISCGGPLDAKAGVVHSPPNLPGWEVVPVRALFEKAFPGAQVALENDANATALAEWRWGAGQGARDIVFVTMGTGIGGGLILDGRLYRGASDLAGEIGHQTVLLDGPLCGCGKRGCLEALASGPAIARLARERLAYGRGKALLARAGGDPERITAREVVEEAKAGEPLCVGVLRDAGTWMGLGLANVVQVLNPERIVLGTIAVHAGELVLGPIRAAVAEFAWERARAACEIVTAALGDRAQDLAAISLVAEG